MVIKEEQERVRTLLSDTITLLCRNGLTFKTEFNISALIGITLDKNEVFLVDIRETIKTELPQEEGSGAESEALSTTSTDRKSHKKRKRRHKKSSARRDSHRSDSGSDSDHGGSVLSDSEEPPQKNIKQEGEEEDDDDDLVFVKDEPGVANASALSYNALPLSQQTFSGSVAGPQPGSSSGAMDQSMYGGEQLTSGSWDGSVQSFPSASGSSSMLVAAGQPPDAGGTPPNPAAAAAAQTLNYAQTDTHQPRRYMCHLCGRSWDHKHHYQGHMVSKHNVQGMTRLCPLCGKSFGRLDVLKRHIRMIHKDVQPGTEHNGGHTQ